MTTSTEKPLPDLGDPVAAPFWRAARDGRLVVPRCADCGYKFWPPEAVCPECYGSAFAWDEVAPAGTLWSFAVYHRALDPAFAADIPYAVGLVELDGGLKMYGIMRGDISSLHIDGAVTAVFEPATDEVTFVRWRMADQV
jgi:hypothetical protein